MCAGRVLLQCGHFIPHPCIDRTRRRPRARRRLRCGCLRGCRDVVGLPSPSCFEVDPVAIAVGVFAGDVLAGKFVGLGHFVGVDKNGLLFFGVLMCMNPATMQPSRRNFSHTPRKLRSCSHSRQVTQSEVGIFKPAFFRSARMWCVPYGSYILPESRRRRQEAAATSATCVRVANCSAPVVVVCVFITPPEYTSGWRMQEKRSPF